MPLLKMTILISVLLHTLTFAWPAHFLRDVELSISTYAYVILLALNVILYFSRSNKPSLYVFIITPYGKKVNGRLLDGEWNFACAFANWAFFNVSHNARSKNFWKKFHNNGNARISWTVMLKSTFTLAMPILTNFILIGILSRS